MELMLVVVVIFYFGLKTNIVSIHVKFVMYSFINVLKAKIDTELWLLFPIFA